MPPPVDKQGLHRLLGMTKFLAQYMHSRIQDLQSRQHLYYDQSAKPLPALDPGTTTHADTTWLGASHSDRPEMWATLLQCDDSSRKSFKEEQTTFEEDTSESVQRHWLDWRLRLNTLWDTWVYWPDQDPPPQVLPSVSMNSSSEYHTRSGRAVRHPVRFRD